MRQRCGMRLPGATGKAAPGAERGQRIRELTARGQCCGAAVRRQRGGFLILVFLCYVYEAWRISSCG